MSLVIFGQKVELRSEVQINASADAVWETLTNLKLYSSWNPFVVEAHGTLQVGETVRTVVSLPGGGEHVVRRRVLKIDPLHELRWSSRLIHRAIAYREQFFLLRQCGETEIRLVVGENFSGLIGSRHNARIMQLSQGLALMNQSLKRRVESAPARHS
jgi:hypothetical protein